LNILDGEVSHKIFGAGTVIAQKENIVKVRFSEDYGEKRFQYPAAFGSFLTLTDSELRKEVDKELQAWLEAERMERQQREEEAARKKEEERAALLEQAAAKKKTPARAKKA